ncbi:hypothetical protein BKA70DRAFT_1430197 [Coprinopsis sp. MPI-PUGE-AT-0042]|nr:hypothetical protein BKA70DRAFT_1430197 [Coprinopsis sp. MPI-PUGE-AT-0042]
MVRSTTRQAAPDTRGSTPATPKSPKAGDRRARANTITPRDSKRRRGDEADSSPADEDDEEEGGGEGEEETSDEMSQAAEAASSSAPEVYDGDSEEEEEPEPPRRSARQKNPPSPAAPSSDISEDELNFPSSPIKPVPKKTKAATAPKATATVAPTAKRPATALKQTIQPAASTTTTTKAKPAVKATAKPAIKTKPTVKAPVDNSTTGTENILQALNASIAPPPRKVAPPPPIAIPPAKPAVAAPKPKKKVAVKEVIQEEEVEVPEQGGDVEMQDMVEEQGRQGRAGLQDMDMDVDTVEEVKEVKRRKGKGKGKDKEVLAEDIEGEKEPSMAELDAPEDDGVVYDEEDEFSAFVNPVTLEVGPSKLQGASKTVGGTLRGKAAFSNMADLELEKIVSETVAIPRKARVFLDPLVSLGLVNRLVPDFFVTVNGSTVKDVLNAIVEGDPSYAGHTCYIYDFDEAAWTIKGSSIRLGPDASISNNAYWESEKNSLYIYVVLKKPASSTFSSRATTPSVSGHRSRSVSGVPSPLATGFSGEGNVKMDAEEEEAIARIAAAIDCTKPTRDLRIIYYLDMPTDHYFYTSNATDNWSAYRRYKMLVDAKEKYQKMLTGAVNADGKKLPEDLKKLTVDQIIAPVIGTTTFYTAAKIYSKFSNDLPHHKKVMKYFAMNAVERHEQVEEQIFEHQAYLRKYNAKASSGMGLAKAFLILHGDLEKEGKKKEVEEEEEERSPEKKSHKRNKKQKGGNYFVYLCTFFSTFGLLAASFFLSWLGQACLAAFWLPLVAAQPTSLFPDITFRAFNRFVRQNYDSNISLSSVLLILFTVLENPQLLNLHFRRSVRQLPGETSSNLWIKRLGQLLELRFTDKEPLLHSSVSSLGTTLHKLALLLDLSSPPLHPIDLSAVEPSLALVTNSFECQKQTCAPHSLYPYQSFRDISSPVTLIKGTKQYGHAYVLGAECTSCATSYMADHHYQTTMANGQERTLENDACYIKLGQKLWADRTFTGAVSNAFHSLRSSAQAFSSFFTDSYVSNSSSPPPPVPLSASSPATPPPTFHSLQSVTRRHIWQAHLGESIRMIAADSGLDLTVPFNVGADQLVQHAFNLLGNKGKVKPAEGHACGECTQPYRTTTELDSVVEGCSVNMRVVDGIVTGPLHCARPKCYNPLANNRGESYCEKHVREFGHFCRIIGCRALAKTGTRACELHAPEWKHYQASASRSSSSGVKRMIH